MGNELGMPWPPSVHGVTRRQLLKYSAKTALACPALSLATALVACGGGPATSPSSPPPPPPPVSDDDFLDEIERAIFLYFWEQASAATGLVKDRALAAGNDTRTVASIAAT